jgi:hypothetical protein
MATGLLVGIELRRASCRRRVIALALSIARRVHNSTMATFSEAPPIMPYGRISEVRFEVLAMRLPWVFPAWRGLSADSQYAPTSMVCPGSRSISYVGSLSALCPTTPLNDGTTKHPESLCPMLVLPPLWRRVPSPRRALPLPHRSYGLIRRCESFLRCLSPCHGGPAGCICVVLPQRHRPSRAVKWVGFPLLSANTTFHGYLFGAAAISLCSGLRVCLPPWSFLPLQVSLQGS